MSASSDSTRKSAARPSSWNLSSSKQGSKPRDVPEITCRSVQSTRAYADARLIEESASLAALRCGDLATAGSRRPAVCRDEHGRRFSRSTGAETSPPVLSYPRHSTVVGNRSTGRRLDLGIVRPGVESAERHCPHGIDLTAWGNACAAIWSLSFMATDRMIEYPSSLDSDGSVQSARRG